MIFAVFILAKFHAAIVDSIYDKKITSRPTTVHVYIEKLYAVF